MFEKNMQIAYLLDIYGDVLDEHARQIMKAYYEDDLSLSEIAEGEDISRQGIRHIIKKSEEELLFLDERLKLSEHYTKLENFFSELLKISDDLLSSDDKEKRGSAERINLLINRFGSNQY